MKTTEQAVPDGRCTDCGTAKPPAGAPTCQGCRMLRILGIPSPMSPYTSSEHKEKAA